MNDAKRTTLAAPDADPAAAAFGDTVARLHLRLGGVADEAPTVGAWAQRAWASTAEGHVCIALAECGATAARASAADLRQLAASPAVTDRPDVRPAPLAMDRGALYLYRWWQAETALARAVAALDAASPLAASAAVDEALDAVFPRPDRDPRQHHAARLALERRLALLTGGPGTGKTTTLARLLVAFLKLRPGARVAFAAPTGKAAARLAQSLAAQLPQLDPRGQLAGRLPTGGMTVHRLLAEAQGPGRGGRIAGQVHYDLVIVDEASMLDVEIAARLARSIPAHGRLVLAGDRDQLASVEAGAVFAELCAAGLGGIAALDRNYRQADAPRITALAAALRAGDADAVELALADATEPGGAGEAAAGPPGAAAGNDHRESWLALGAGARPASIAGHAFDGYGPALDAIAAGAAAREVLALFDRYRVLCALRGGERGALAINAAIAALVRRRTGAAPAAPWYPGRLVMISRNEPDLGLFNGDVGVCLPLPLDDAAPHASPDDAARDETVAPVLAVAFVAGDATRWLPVLQMPACEDAFAITVHKSQGSEFACAAVVPAPSGHPLNTRELVYTAATRARQRLLLWADPGTLVEAARRRSTRNGLLADRIAGAGTPG